jgi:F0F1-type ATP synthase assembly protein I
LSGAPPPRKPSGGELAGLGISIAVAFLVPLLLGVVFDALLHTSPFGVLIGLLVGITASCYTAVARLRPYV